MLGPIGQIALPARDIERATAFYRDSLGLPLLFRAGHLSFFDCGGVRLMLAPPETPEAAQVGSVLYFRVDDIQSSCRTLSDRGVRFMRQPHLVARMPDHELWMAFFRDSEANILAVMSEVRG